MCTDNQCFRVKEKTIIIFHLKINIFTAVNWRVCVMMFHYFSRIVWHESYLATFSHTLPYFSATRPDNFLVFTDTDNRLIFRMDLTTHSFVVVPLWRSGNPIAIDYDPVDGRIYWTDVAFKEIHSASIDGQDQRVVKYLGSSKFLFGIILNNHMEGSGSATIK